MVVLQRTLVRKNWGLINGQSNNKVQSISSSPLSTCIFFSVEQAAEPKAALPVQKFIQSFWLKHPVEVIQVMILQPCVISSLIRINTVQVFTIQGLQLS